MTVSLSLFHFSFPFQRGLKSLFFSYTRLDLPSPTEHFALQCQTAALKNRLLPATDCFGFLAMGK
jgi:hypothetical protein